MDPIEIIEKELRHLIDDVLSDKFGVSWFENPNNVGLGDEWLSKLKEKARNDKPARGDETIYEHPIAYSEFSDLKAILINRADLFKKIFKEWDKIVMYIDTVEKLRNPVKHHRDISDSQQYLLAGIAGEITDDIYLWRIGTSAEVRETVIEFRDYIPTDNQTNEEITTASKAMVTNLSFHLIEALKKSGVKDDSISEKREDFVSEIRAPQIVINIHTSPKAGSNSGMRGLKFKNCITSIHHKSASRTNLDSLLTYLGKQYLSIEFVLSTGIDIGSLMKWSLEKSGLSPGSSVSGSNGYGNADYGFLGGKLRIGVISDGRIRLTCDDPESLWFPHKIISAKHLFGFMLGNITPRTMMHLHRRSFVSLSAIGDSSSSDC